MIGLQIPFPLVGMVQHRGSIRTSHPADTGSKVTDTFWRRRDSNLGLVGDQQEWQHYAVQSPYVKLH